MARCITSYSQRRLSQGRGAFKDKTELKTTSKYTLRHTESRVKICKRLRGQTKDDDKSYDVIDGTVTKKGKKKTKRSVQKTKTASTSCVVPVKPRHNGEDSFEAIKSLGDSINRYQIRNKETPECVFDTKNVTNIDDYKTNSADIKSLNHIQIENSQPDEIAEVNSKQQQIEELVSPSQEKMQGKCNGDFSICAATNWKASLSSSNNTTSATFTLPYQMTGIHTSATVVANRTDNANSTILQCTVVLENTPSST